MSHATQYLATAAALALLPLCWVLGSPQAAPGTTPDARSLVTTTSTPAPVRASLPDGVPLPDGAVVLGTSAVRVGEGDLHESLAYVRLSGVSAAAALDTMLADLSALGWQVRHSRSDVFAVRKVADRWQLCQVRIDAEASQAFHGAVLTVMIGSRPA